MKSRVPPSHKQRSTASLFAVADGGFQNRRWIVVAGLVLVAATSSAAIASFRINASESCPTKMSAPRPPVIAVDLCYPTMQSFADTISVTGTIAARDRLPVSAECNGLRIDNIFAEEGQFVRKGQVLAIFNTDILQANLREEQALLRIAESHLSKSQQPNRKEVIAIQRAATAAAESDILQKTAQLKRAKAEYQNAVSISARYESLYLQGATTAQETAQKKTDVQTFLSGLNSAEEMLKQSQLSALQAKLRLSELESGGRAEDIVAARGEVDRHTARIEQIEAQLSQALVKAPDDGLVSERFARLGDVGVSGKPLFTVIRKGELELVGKLCQSDLQNIRVGQDAVVRSDRATARGVIWLISPTVDANTRMGTVRIRLDSGARLLTGMFASGLISAGARSALAVPESCIQKDAVSSFVFVFSDGRVRRRNVQVGLASKHFVEVKGVGEREAVVRSGCSFLSDGDTVSIANQRR